MHGKRSRHRDRLINFNCNCCASSVACSPYSSYEMLAGAGSLHQELPWQGQGQKEQGVHHKRHRVAAARSFQKLRQGQVQARLPQQLQILTRTTCAGRTSQRQASDRCQPARLLQLRQDWPPGGQLQQAMRILQRERAQRVSLQRQESRSQGHQGGQGARAHYHRHGACSSSSGSRTAATS